MDMLMFFGGVIIIMVMGFVLNLIMYAIQLHVVKRSAAELAAILCDAIDDNMDDVDDIYDYIQEMKELKIKEMKSRVDLLESANDYINETKEEYLTMADKYKDVIDKFVKTDEDEEKDELDFPNS